jgi:hypothetical protein
MSVQSAVKLLCAVAVVAALAGCAAPTRFEWGDYDNALYRYTKQPDAKPGFELALDGAIKAGRATNRLAPGLLAELGYLKLEEGKVAEAIEFFRQEMTAFPQSKVAMERVIARLTPPQPMPAPVEQAPAT